MSFARVLSLRLHGLSDLVLLFTALALPFLLHYADTWAAVYTWALAGVGLTLNFFTDYPLGAVRVIPRRVHSLVEWSALPAFSLLPWLLFPQSPGNPVITVLGLLNALTNGLTDWQLEPAPVLATERADR